MIKLLTILLLLSFTCQAQKVGNWNYVVTESGTGKRPALIFFPGLGEIGNDVNKLTLYGPHAYLRMGFNPLPGWIIISLQPPTAYPNEAAIKLRIDSLIKWYDIDTARINLTGLSHGGWCSSTYVSGIQNSINTVITVQGVKPDDNNPYPQGFSNFKGTGYICFEQRLDGRDGQTVVNYINSQRPGIATFIETNFSGGGHCCWDRFYGGNGTEPENFGSLQSRDIYRWLIAKNAFSPVSLGPQNNTVRTVPSNMYFDGRTIRIKVNIRTEYKIYDILGRQVLSGTLLTGRRQINLSNLASGMYIFVTQYDKTYKILKQ